MGILSFVRRVMRHGTSGFNAFERAVLDAVAQKLPSDAEHRLQERVRAVNLVQRIDGGREVNCYEMQNGRPVLNDATRVDASQGERLFAKFRIDGPPTTANKGEAWLVDGNLFSIEFKDATEHANAQSIVSIHVDIMPSSQTASLS
jgi:hypothetical protein